jgi:hypothetical protein
MFVLEKRLGKLFAYRPARAVSVTPRRSSRKVARTLYPAVKDPRPYRRFNRSPGRYRHFA